MSAPVGVLAGKPATDPLNTPEGLRDRIYSVTEEIHNAEQELRSAEYGEAYGENAAERDRESTRRAYCEQRVRKLRRELADLIEDVPNGSGHHRAALARVGGAA